MNSKQIFLMPISAILLFAVFSMVIPDTIQNAAADGEKKNYRDYDRYYKERQYQEYDYEKDRYNGDKYYNGEYRDYKDKKHSSKVFFATLDGEKQDPPNDSPAQGLATAIIIKDPVSEEKQIWYTVDLLGVPEGDSITAIHLHVTERPNQGTGPHILTFCGAPLDEVQCPQGPGTVVAGAANNGDIEENPLGITDIHQIIKAMKQGKAYINVHSSDFGGEGEIRGFLQPVP
ncbi:MAG: CHRD domain-containing protein [Nitrososphaeraceae archaeon]